jgi:hypothetical protein
VLCILTGLWLISAFDLTLTMLAHNNKLLHESNPIAARVLTQGPEALCAYKVVLVTGGTLILVVYRRRLVAELASALMLVVYTLVAVQWKLCYEMYEKTQEHAPDYAFIQLPVSWIGGLFF